MKRVIIVSEKMSNDLSQMQNLLKLVAIRSGHETCTSGDPVEFMIEEKAIKLEKRANEEILRVHPTSGELIPVEKNY